MGTKLPLPQLVFIFLVASLIPEVERIQEQTKGYMNGVMPL